MPWLATEQYAIKTGTHPKATTAENIGILSGNSTLDLAMTGHGNHTTDPDHFADPMDFYSYLNAAGFVIKLKGFCPEFGTVWPMKRC